MRRGLKIDLMPLVLVVAIGAVPLASAYTALCALAMPEHYKQRLRALDGQLERARSLMSAPGDPGAYPADALCQGAPDQAALELRRKLQGLAASTGVSIAGVVVTPELPDSSGSEAALTGVKLQFQSEGSYEAVVGMLGALTKSRPEIFVDTLDLRSHAALVKLQMSGRAYCSISALR